MLAQHRQRAEVLDEAVAQGAVELQLSGPRLETVFTSHLAVVLKRMALDGRGVAWLPLSLIGDELGDGRLVRAGGEGWPVPVEMRLVRRRAAAAPAAEAFWQTAGADGFAP